MSPSDYLGLHRRYTLLLGDVPQTLSLSKEREEEIRRQLSELFIGMMHTLYSLEGSQFRIEVLAEPKIQKFIDTHAGVLDSSFQKVEMSDVMRKRLQRSDYIFSGMKAFHELNEAFPSLLDENGNRKPFERFLNDVRKIDETYNRNYLRAEYNFVHSSALMAAKWEQFMEDGDRYNLQYRTAGDSKVRPAHAALGGVTLPPSDPFWEEYYPPNGWNCFVGHTPVLTADGWRLIKDIRVGDLVVGGSGEYRTVIAVHTREVDSELVSVCTKGAFATCTENHRFLTRRGWVPAMDLKPGDILIQVGEVSALGKLVNAIDNTVTLGKYLFVALIRKRKPVSAQTVDGKVKRREEKINNINTKQLALLDKISRFGGINNPAAFNGFDSVYDFLRQSFFHTRYSLVDCKNITKRRKTTVYNLSVDGDESYIVPVGIAHNCRCTVVQVRKSKYPTTPHDEAMARGEEALQRDTKGIFRFNPGKEEKAVPDYNPYTIRRCRDCDIAKGKLKLAFIPDNELCAACKLIRQCEQNREVSYKHGKGEVRISHLVSSKDADYPKLVQVAEFFAKDGATATLTPKMSRPPKFQYECVYKSLIGTKYEGKCPDLNINGEWYEHEGFTSSNPKNAFRNMMRDGLLQSSRLIIDRPDLSERYMKRRIINRIEQGQDIREIWLRNEDGTLTLLYKKTDG